MNRQLIERKKKGIMDKVKEETHLYEAKGRSSMMLLLMKILLEQQVRLEEQKRRY